MKFFSLRQFAVIAFVTLFVFPGSTWSDSVSDQELPYMPGEVLVKFKPESIDLDTRAGRAKSQMFLMAE